MCACKAVFGVFKVESHKGHSRSNASNHLVLFHHKNLNEASLALPGSNKLQIAAPARLTSYCESALSAVSRTPPSGKHLYLQHIFRIIKPNRYSFTFTAWQFPPIKIVCTFIFFKSLCKTLNTFSLNMFEMMEGVRGRHEKYFNLWVIPSHIAHHVFR